MKIKGSVFASPKVKELFESEGYIQEEWRQMMQSGAILRSRKYERMAYVLAEGKLTILNLR